MAPSSLSVLHDYDGYEFVFEHGYTARFKFKEVPGTAAPHPFRYALTLHEPNGKRILGYDNAHPTSRKTGRFRHRSAVADHLHGDQKDKGTPYEFESPEKLLEDFIKLVSAELERRGITMQDSEVREVTR